MGTSPQCEAIVQLARKRQVLDRAGCARLQILLRRAGVESVADARSFLAGAGLLPPPVARRLLQALPESDARSFGDHRPLVHLADGGMGSAWLAADPRGRLVVIKTMRGNLAGNPEVKARFEREVRIMQDFVHPNVVQCLDSGASGDGTLYMVLEFVDGGDLKDLMDAQGALPEAMGLAVAYQVADALVLAEQYELVHRDIKPANIFATEDGRAKLADFGIARSTAIERTQLTMQGAVVGSPYFMSPEQVRADPQLSTASDLYALGAVLYTCLAGTEPYRGALQEVLHAHCTAPVPEIRQLRPQIGHSTASIITRCMQKQVQDRFPSARDLRDAVGEALAGLERHEVMPGMAAATAPPRGEQETMATLATEGAVPGATQATVSLVGTIDRTLTAVLVEVDGAPGGEDLDATVAADLAAGDLDATVATDCSGGDLQATVTSELDHTFAAEVSGSAAAETTGSEPLTGDLAQAMNHRWVTLTAPSGVRVVLVAKRLLVAGKLCEPPVDLCLRLYPSDRHRDACLRISRQHLRLEFAEHAGIQVTDLGSGNGSELDGAKLEANSPKPLRDRHKLRVAGVLDLDLKVVPRSGTETWDLEGAPPSTGGFGCGIEIGHTVDAVIATRATNEPGLAYAMVLRRLTLGGPGCDLPISGCAPEAKLELALYGGRWITRRDRGDSWRPLLKGMTLELGGLTLTAQPGAHSIFD